MDVKLQNGTTNKYSFYGGRFYLGKHFPRKDNLLIYLLLKALHIRTKHLMRGRYVTTVHSQIIGPVEQTRLEQIRIKLHLSLPLCQ